MLATAGASPVQTLEPSLAQPSVIETPPEFAKTPPKRALFFVSPWIDGLMMGGLGLLVWIALTVVGAGTYQAVGMAGSGWLLAAAILFDFPHFAAVSWPLYSHVERVKRFPVTALIWPLALLAALLIGVRYPDTVLPCLCKAGMAWLAFHFAAQTAGLVLLYLRRAGLNPSRAEGLCVSAASYLSMLYALLSTETRDRPLSFGSLQEAIPRFPVTEDIGLLVALLFGCALTGIAACVLLAKVRRGRWWPPIALVPLAAQVLWFVPEAGGYDLFTRLLCFGCVHGLQYLTLAVAIEAAEVRAQHPEWSRGQVLSNLALFYPILLGLGAAVFLALPWLLQPLRVAAHLVGPAFLAALWMHHAFVDGGLNKPRSPEATRLADLTLAREGWEARP